MSRKRIVVVTRVKSHARNKANGMRVAKALLAIGHDVIQVGHEQGVRRQALAGADLVLIFGTLVTDEAKRPGLFARIRAEKPASAVMALWYFDLCHPAMTHAPWKYTTMRRIVPTLDWLVMTDHSYAWEKHAPRFLHLMQGVDADEFAGKTAPPEPRRRDIIFTGGYHTPFDNRLPLINILKERFWVGVFGSSTGRYLFGDNFFIQHQRSRVALVPRPPAYVERDYWSNRIYLATATGTPCIAGYVPGLERHFEDGKEAMFFHDSREAVQKAAKLVSDPALRQAVGSAGRRRTLTEHTYEARARTLMATIFGDKGAH